MSHLARAPCVPVFLLLFLSIRSGNKGALRGARPRSHKTEPLGGFQRSSRRKTLLSETLRLVAPDRVAP